jgi:hypothetical protein
MEGKKTHNYFIAGLVSLVTFLVYLPALRNGFVNWDDADYVYENPHIRSLNLKLLHWAFFDFYASNWHPLTWLSHAMDYAIWGLNPFGHHLFNNTIHSLNAFLVALLAMTFVEISLKKSSRRNNSAFFPNEHSRLIVGATTGLLFGIHPLHVESVAWIAERKDLLCALFFLLSVKSYLNLMSEETGGDPQRPRGAFPFFRKQYLHALGFFALALLSKPMAVTLPAVLLIIDWYPSGRISSMRTFKHSLTEKLPFFVLSFFSSVLTILAHKSGGAIVPFKFEPLSTRLIVGAKALVSYFSKMLYPRGLIPFYPYPRDVSLMSFKYLPFVLLVVACTAVCMIISKKHKLLPAALSYYVITLLPVLGIIQVGGQSMADRYVYLPCIGPFMLFGLGVAFVFEKTATAKAWGRIARLTAVAASIILMLFLAYSSVRQITIWRTPVTLWNYIIEKEPEAMTPAYYNLGLYYGQQGLLDLAIENLGKAIDINPRFDMAYNNRGAAFYLQSRFDRAIADFSQAIYLNPDNAEAYINRGYAYLRQGDKALAAADLGRGCSLGNNLGCRALRDLSK